uniref:Reverse transcriptase domain-containing protein n=1 Tax=Tetrabaena socialis TaxID=47790 RepID=A0A1B1FK66_9CHLO|nr:hypothetical protein [Tetrabaena socialis]
MKLTFKSKKLLANTTFSPEKAKKLVNTDYYKTQSENMRKYEYLEQEKIRLSTPKWDKVTQLLDYYKNLGSTQPSSTGRALLGIYNKNVGAVHANPPIKNYNLISIIAKPETLLLAYKEIKGNKGSLSKGGAVSKEAYMNMSAVQKEAYLKSFSLPDGMSFYQLNLISKLIRTGKYPWGTSSRIYIDKPGQPEKKRPITIPPFTDRLVQKAIELVLQAIYEPYFESMNRSFGYRSNKSTLDALAAVLSTSTTGMRTAVEGDVEGAFDNVDRKILINILKNRIQDTKFIKLIEDRLNYDFVEKESNLRIRPDLGIPQGGTDSPILFNIYMHELDVFVHKELPQVLEKLNSKIKVDRVISKTFTSIKAEKKKYLRNLKAKKTELAKLPREDNLEVIPLKKEVYSLVKKIRLTEHRKNRISSSPSNRRILRFFYVRYADDWLLLTNGDKEIAQILKKKIANFLKDQLKLTLSEKKTLITDITKKTAKYLGFELKISSRGALRKTEIKNKTSKRRFILSKKSGLLVWAQPDRQRLIDRLHMKGFCTKAGFPTTLPWLSCLEAHAIIERFNATIRGLAQYYLPAIRNRAKIHRWIYILRYSCLKTLAQKYKSTISKIFKRFGHNLNSKKNQTVRIRVEQKVRDKTVYKDWTLLTYNDLVSGPEHKNRFKKATKIFWDREFGVIGKYELGKGNMPKVTNEDFLEKITWVSWRTAAAIDMPCANCGTDKLVHQHHIKHIRKRAYTLIPEQQSYQQIMAESKYPYAKIATSL